MKFKRKLFLFILTFLIPALLSELIQTESTTVYLWWERLISYIIITALMYSWIDMWYNKLLKKYED